MTPERLRQIARDCEDPAVVCSEDNAAELRRFADTLDNNVNHTCWVWNRRIIEEIRAAVPNAPVLDEDLAKVIRVELEAKAELLAACRDAAAYIYADEADDVLRAMQAAIGRAEGRG